jgi:hypothetical protein
VRFVASGKKISVKATIVIAASMKKAPMRRPITAVGSLIPTVNSTATRSGDNIRRR